MSLHQQALIEQNMPLAMALYELLEENLQLHIRLENELVFSQHCQLETTRWPSSLYLAEHNKITDLLQQCRHRLQNPKTQNGNLKPWIIQTLDFQRTLKNVLEHHEEREEMTLLPELDKQLDKYLKTDLIKELNEQWHQATQKIQLKLKRLGIQAQ